MYPTIFAGVEHDDRWIVVALAWQSFVNVPVPGGARIITQGDCPIYLFSLN